MIEENDLLYPIEIKSGQTVATDMFRSLRWWSNLANQPLEKGILIYGGKERFTRNGLSVRPWYAI